MSTSPSKRPRAASTVDAPPPKKQKRTDPVDEAGIYGHQTSSTAQLFRSRYGIELSTKKFVGLCAYLCALLRLGYKTTVREMDQFVSCYDLYLAALPEIHQAQMNSDRVRIPSYHHWIRLARSSGAITIPAPRSADAKVQAAAPKAHPILSEELVRAIWSENPFSFLRAEQTLLSMGKRHVQKQGLTVLQNAFCKLLDVHS